MGDYILWVDDDGIIRGILRGVHDEQNAKSIISEINKISEKIGKARVLMDLSKTERGTLGARRAHFENIKTQPPTFAKLALFGANTMNRIMVKFLIKASGSEERVKYFKIPEEGLLWLKER